MLMRSWIAWPRGVAAARPVSASVVPASKPKLRLHQVDAIDLLGDGVLDLQARVGFDEEELLRRIVDQELEGAEAAILHGLGHGDRGIDDPQAQRGAEMRAGRQLDDLLVAALYRAVAFAQGHDAALAIAHDLHLDVACAVDQPFGIERPVAEGGFRFSGTARSKASAISPAWRTGRMPRPPPPAMALIITPDFACFSKNARTHREIGGAVRAGQQRHRCLDRMGAGARLVAEEVELLGRRTDEDQSRLGAGLREGGILRQEAVARMHRVAARRLRGRDDASDIEIGRRAPPLQGLDLIDAPDMQGRRVVLRMDADGGDAEFGGGLGDTDGDLAAIGDQEFLEHVGASRGKPPPCRKGCSLWRTRRRRTPFPCGRPWNAAR